MYGAQAIAAGTNWKFTVPYRFEEIGKIAVDTGVSVAGNCWSLSFEAWMSPSAVSSR
jgi:hypothetical protein